MCSVRAFLKGLVRALFCKELQGLLACRSTCRKLQWTQDQLRLQWVVLEAHRVAKEEAVLGALDLVDRQEARDPAIGQWDLAVPGHRQACQRLQEVAGAQVKKVQVEAEGSPVALAAVRKRHLRAKVLRQRGVLRRR